MANKHWEQNKDATIYVGNLDERFSEPLMWEMMTQMGPVINLHMPMDRVSRTHQGYGFVEFDTSESAEYASRMLNGIRVFGKVIRVNKASADKQKAAEIGAELFVNNLDPQVDEKILYDTFGRFGQLVSPPNVVRDANNISKGYGFVSFDSFEASDAARDTMNGQYLLSKQITVEYAYKKDGKGERHGDEAERKLAREGKKHNIMPEQQQFPSAFLMKGPAAADQPPASAPTGPSAATNGVGGGGHANGAVPSPAAGGPAPTGFDRHPPSGAPSGPAGGHHPPVNMPPPHLPQSGGIPTGFGPGGPGLPTRGGMPPAMFAGMPPPGGPRGGMPLPVPLPPAPSGLPARPPPSHSPVYSSPTNDFRPGGGGPAGFRGGPPPPPGMGGMPAPPQGFAPPAFGAPPNGAVVPPPGMPGGPPPGFMPPPGFVPPPGGVPPPPPGFGMRR